MSNISNDNLVERAKEMIIYWAGELPGRLLIRDLDAGDMEALAHHLTEAEGKQALQEDYLIDHPDPETLQEQADEARDSLRYEPPVEPFPTSPETSGDIQANIDTVRGE